MLPTICACLSGPAFRSGPSSVSSQMSPTRDSSMSSNVTIPRAPPSGPSTAAIWVRAPRIPSSRSRAGRSGGSLSATSTPPPVASAALLRHWTEEDSPHGQQRQGRCGACQDGVSAARKQTGVTCHGRSVALPVPPATGRATEQRGQRPDLAHGGKPSAEVLATAQRSAASASRPAEPGVGNATTSDPGNASRVVFTRSPLSSSSSSAVVR